MALDPLRSLRLKWEAARDSEGDRGRLRNPGRDALCSRGVPRFVGQVVSGGATPTAVDHVFLVLPMRIDGDEAEGAVGTTVVDSTRPIPVVIVGGRPPVIGEFVVAHATGGRWVADLSGPAPTMLPCSPCAIPRRSLTVSWTNGQIGEGSTLLTFDGVNQWRSGCVDSLAFRLACQEGSIVFSATLFNTGACPDGPSQTCSSSTADPIGLTLTRQECSPFLLMYQVTTSGCPLLAGRGYQQFAITQ